MKTGLALPQFDHGARADLAPVGRALDAARQAEAAGFDAVFLTDRPLGPDPAPGDPGAPPGAEPVTALAAVAAVTERVRIGSLVVDAALRPPRWLAKNLAGVDVLSGGRLIAGLGAGWAPSESVGDGLPDGPRPERLRHLEEVVAELRRAWAGQGPPLRPAPRQPGGPPLWVGAQSDGEVGVAARVGDGWSTAWRVTPAAYEERRRVFEEACERAGRDPGAAVCSVGLTTLVGTSDADLHRRFEAMVRAAPPGAVTAPLADWRVGRLVGTVEEVRDQVGQWGTLGVAMVIADLGALPFSAEPSADDALALCAAALTEES